jgi:hypothetical protein
MAEEGPGTIREVFISRSSIVVTVSRQHWEKYSTAYMVMELTILDYYELNPFLTDREVIRALKSVRRMYRGEDTRRDYTPLPWALSQVLGVVAMWKSYSAVILVNCIDHLIQSVENHTGGRKSRGYLDFLSAFMEPLWS